MDFPPFGLNVQGVKYFKNILVSLYVEFY